MFFRSVSALCDLVCKGIVMSAACLLYCHYLIKWMLLEVKPVVTLSYLLYMKFVTNPYCIKEIVCTGWSFPIDYVDEKTRRFFVLTLFGTMPSFLPCTLSVPPLPNFCHHTLYFLPICVKCPFSTWPAFHFCFLLFIPLTPFSFLLCQKGMNGVERKGREVGVGKRTQVEGEGVERKWRG